MNKNLSIILAMLLSIAVYPVDNVLKRNSER